MKEETLKNVARITLSAALILSVKKHNGLAVWAVGFYIHISHPEILSPGFYW
jgi:hypothetical protein